MSRLPTRYQDIKHLYFLNRSGDAASKLYKAVYPYGVLSLILSGDGSIVNGKSLSMATTDQAMSVPSIGSTFQAYSAKNTPYNHW